jgi:hypothetical protein
MKQCFVSEFLLCCPSTIPFCVHKCHIALMSCILFPYNDWQPWVRGILLHTQIRLEAGLSPSFPLCFHEQWDMTVCCDSFSFFAYSVHAYLAETPAAPTQTHPPVTPNHALGPALIPGPVSTAVTQSTAGGRQKCRSRQGTQQGASGQWRPTATLPPRAVSPPPWA